MAVKSTKNFESLLRNSAALRKMHNADIAKMLDSIKNEYEDRFYSQLDTLPRDILGGVLVNMPEKYRYEVLERLNAKELTLAIEELESDDATDLIQEIEEVDPLKAEVILNKINREHRVDIKRLKEYGEHEAGSYMQTELFDVLLNEKIEHALGRLRVLKNSGELENLHHAFITDEEGRLLGSVLLEDLIIFDFKKTFKEMLGSPSLQVAEVIKVHENEDIRDVTKKFEHYDVSAIPVVDDEGVLIGRITSDDVYDIIESSATEQIYNLAGVDDDIESEERVFEIWKSRFIWLSVNLFTAILASIVINMFDATIESLVALAVLMPIVASMGGNAGTQSLTVVVRQLALGNIDVKYAKNTIKREVAISLFNGGMFAIIMGLITYLWFDHAMLGVVIGLAMIANLLVAGLFGSAIPFFLKKLNIDPATASSIFLTTITDIIGFLSFLGLAAWILL